MVNSSSAGTRRQERGSGGLEGWREDGALLILRAVIGVVFLVHGGQKLFILGLPGVVAFMGRLGIPLPGVAGPVVALVESLGGLAVLSGLCARWGAGLLACEMLVAILTVHLPNGFFLPRGFEYPLTLLAGALALALLGPGRLSVEGWWAQG